jgi:predicted membrane protein
MENDSSKKPSASSIIEDNSGGISSIRILMLLWGVGVFLIWGFGAVVAIIHGTYIFPTIPPEVVTILLGVTGIKTVQRFGEK